MRRLHTFDSGPKSLHLEIEYAHPNVLTAGSPGRIRRVAPYLENPILIEADRGLVTVHGTYKNMPVTAFSTGMGPASVSITLPEVIEAYDGDIMNILRIGTSGGLQRYLGIGDLIISKDIERAEDTSDHSMGLGYRASCDSWAIASLKGAAILNKKDFQKIYSGTTRTTSDIYFDAEASRTRHIPNDLLAVSMEGSVICALRDRYNIDQNRNIMVGEMLAISDNVLAHGDKIDGTEFLQRHKDVESAMIKIGLEALLHLNYSRTAASK